jgi:trk system potassium uptake protein TrkA
MAAQLSVSGHTVTLIDSDPKVAERFTGAANTVPVTLGDACELGTLSRAGADMADVLAAVTGDDEDNLVISLLAKQEFGVSRVVARVNNPANEWMFNDMWGVDVSVSTPHLLAGLVEEAVNVGSFVRLLSLQHGRARISEVTLAEDSPARDRQIAELGLPRDSSVVALIRDGHVVVPRGDTTLHLNDEVIVLVSAEAEQEVRSIFVQTSDDMNGP